MEIAEKRKMVEVLRGLIGTGFDGNQEEICQFLKGKGYKVTQSTVSRTLKKMGAVKVTNKDKVSYQLKPQAHQPQYRGSLAGIVQEIHSNESMIVIKTTPGSAMFVAGFFDHYCNEDIIGTVAGDDTIFVAPKTIKNIAKHKKEIQAFIDSH